MLGRLLLSCFASGICFKQTLISKIPMGIFSAEYGVTSQYLKTAQKMHLK